ncbi:MAG: hypothetical protein A4E72_00016 [Syntrophus sp. PtaU1.Bin208]|nr:MAG: hypothetical protein A4E72_00016 [Syntrophus sp. PtaU1.Bin208]
MADPDLAVRRVPYFGPGPRSIEIVDDLDLAVASVDDRVVSFRVLDRVIAIEVMIVIDIALGAAIKVIVTLPADQGVIAGSPGDIARPSLVLVAQPGVQIAVEPVIAIATPQCIVAISPDERHSSRGMDGILPTVVVCPYPFVSAVSYDRIYRAPGVDVVRSLVDGLYETVDKMGAAVHKDLAADILIVVRNRGRADKTRQVEDMAAVQTNPVCEERLILIPHIRIPFIREVAVRNDQFTRGCRWGLNSEALREILGAGGIVCVDVYDVRRISCLGHLGEAAAQGMADDIKGSKMYLIVHLAIGDELDHRAKLFSRHIAGGNA